MEVCPGVELIAIENATALGHDVLEISKRPEAQMIRHMRHGSPPRLIALQSILSPNRRESLPTPSAGVRMRGRNDLVTDKNRFRPALNQAYSWPGQSTEQITNT